MVAIGREPTARGLKEGAVGYKPFACPYRRAPNGAMTLTKGNPVAENVRYLRHRFHIIRILL